MSKWWFFRITKFKICLQYFFFWKCVFLFSIVLKLFKYIFSIVFIAGFINRDTDWINPSSSVNKTFVHIELKRMKMKEREGERSCTHKRMSERDIMTMCMGIKVEGRVRANKRNAKRKKIGKKYRKMLKHSW